MKTSRIISLFAGLIIVMITLTYNSCSKKEENNGTVPLITTKGANDVTSSTAKVGGVVASNGGASVIDRGVCYSTSLNPTIDDLSIQSGSGLGAFDCTIAGLSENTTYYYNAYAINSVGIGYGEQKSFTTQGGGGGDLPTVTTNSVSNITETTATSGGNVSTQGSSSVTAKGVCWSTSSNPTTSDPHTTDGSGTGSFTSNITGLTANTLYYVRAYATNSVGIGYGNQQTFNTLGGGGSGCEGVISVNYQGQTYNTVEIGDQCWFKENLNYQTGTSWCYDNNPANCATYGRLYDWGTALSVCPSGWHLPNDEEWKILEGTVDTQYGVGDPEWNQTGDRGFDAGKHLKSITGWYNNGNGSNSSGFTALPGGHRNSDGSFSSIVHRGFWWSATVHSGTSAWYRNLNYNRDQVNRINSDKTNGFSVRCIKD